jgi:glycosyltransferase involved in cell wall biosynthesis
MRFSIIICNYNYERFVSDSIRSALAVDWPDKEIIVVDDGSTDRSRAAIESFGDRIDAIFTENGGQPNAANVGFVRSSGELVIFLDADDVLLATVARETSAAWRPGVVKVQYPMLYVDAALRPLGGPWPTYTEMDTPQLIAHRMRQTGDYRSSPTSGNVWSRDFLNEVFPLPMRDDGLLWIDMYLQKLAPFFGDVVCLRTAQCCYRRHSDNNSRFRSVRDYLEIYPAQVKQVESVQRLGDDLLRRRGKTDKIRYDNEFYVKVSLISRRFFPHRHVSLMSTVAFRYWKTLWREQFGLRRKLLFFVWSLGVLVTPRSIGGWIVAFRDLPRREIFDVKELRRRLRRRIGAAL